MRKIFPTLFIALVVAGCANVSKVSVGEVTVRGRIQVTIKEAWNQFDRGLNDDMPTWTKDGMAVDALKFYAGLTNGNLIAPQLSSRQNDKPLAFMANMQAADVVALYQALLTRDGSSFTLDKLEASTFAGNPGFRFEYSLIRKHDDVRLRGFAVGTVRSGELFLIHFSAPRLGFYPTLAPQVEELVKSARISR